MNNKSNIDKDIKSKLTISIIASILFVVGIPIIIFSAINSFWFGLVIGIIFVVFGFYGMPLLWVSFGNLKSLKRVVDAVMEENLTTISQIASQLQINEKTAKSYVTQAINKKYIYGYLFDGTTLTPNDKTPPKKKIIQNKCNNCGGVLEKTVDGFYCPYCGSSFEKEN